MKPLLFICLFFLTQSITAQNINIGVNIPEKTEFERAIIYFNDGTSIEGIGRLKTIFTSKEEVIIFKIEAKDKDETWTYKDAKGITFISDEGVTDYKYLKVTKNSFMALYEVVTEGNVTLYKKTLKNSAPLMTPSTIKKTPGDLNSNEHQYENNPFSAKRPTYYVQRENEPYPTKIKDNYIKSFGEYMKNCDVMVEKIRNHEYNYSTLKDLVDYYNANCNE
jgi:hypothetical protein